jgi:membrane protease YdiL (CAAX protease family)
MKKSLQFIIMVCIVSWMYAGVALLLGLNLKNILFQQLFGMVYMLMPTILTIILQIKYKEKPFRNLNISFKINRWFIIAGIMPIINAFIVLGINLLFSSVTFSANYNNFYWNLFNKTDISFKQLSQFPIFVFFCLQIIQTIIIGGTIIAIFAFCEELGWRGYLLKALRGKKMLHISLITGIVWGLWHFPLILNGANYPQYPVLGILMMTVWCILQSPVMTYIVIKSKSVIPAAIFHGIDNNSGVICSNIVGGNDLIHGLSGIVGFISLLIVNIAFFLFDKYITKENIFSKAIADNFYEQ